MKLSFQQTGHKEWLLLADGEAMGFVRQGRAVTARQYLWYAFDLSLESLGTEHLFRRDAVAEILALYGHDMKGSTV